MAKASVGNQSESSESTQPVESIPLAAGLADQDVPSELIVEEPAQQALSSERRHIAKSASLVMLGNLGSSIIGMVRQIVVVALGSSIAGPFNSALLPAQTFNDFLVNGSVPGALIPTFNDYSAPEKRDELRRLVFSIVNLVLLIMFVAAIIFIFISPWFVEGFLVPGYTTAQKQLTLQFSQIVFFSLLGLGPFAVLLAALYALKEFGWPAFATAAYHVGIIIGAIVGGFLGAHYFGYLGLAFGVLLGAAGEIALLIPGLRNQQMRYLFVLDLKHPALRRIVKLYIPVAISFLISTGLIFLDQLLIAAFYARKNTLIPVAAGALSILGYLAVALPFWQTIGMPALAFANTVQNSLHAIVLLIILRVVIGHIRIREMIPAVLKILVATAVMVAVAWGTQLLLGHIALFSLSSLSGRLLTVAVAGR